MDLVKCIYSKNSSLSEPIDGCAFQEEWTKLFLNSGFINHGGSKYDHKVAGKLNMDPQNKEYQTLKNLFSKDNLGCDDLNILVLNKKTLRDTAIPNIQKELNNKEDLATLSIQKKELIKRNDESLYRTQLLSHWRYVHNPEQSALLSVSKDVIRSSLRRSDELVYIVQVFRPISLEDPNGIRKCQNFAKRLCHVIAVLGRQKLTALRDKIVCCSDHIVLGEHSDEPEGILKKPKAKDVIKSALFYIGDTFYNDFRHPECADYSRGLINYAESHSKVPVKLYSKSMEDVCFKDLKLQLGYPYLYMHQGNCEHVIVFSDIRLLTPKEKQLFSDYPLICRVAARRRMVCMTCETFTAKWITHGNRRLSSDPYFFCETCFHSFNYTAKGEKIGEFRAYCYVDITSIT